MRLTLKFCLIGLAMGFVLSGRFGDPDAAERLRHKEQILAKLKNIWVGRLHYYKCDQFIQAARDLQALGQEEAVSLLGELGPDRSELNVNLCLCLMLFQPDKKSDLSIPILGKHDFLGGIEESYWPRVPIVLVDDVPFLIDRGSQASYLGDCGKAKVNWFVNHWKWRTKPYSPATLQTKKIALKKLLKSKMWVTPLEDYERDFLILQIL